MGIVLSMFKTAASRRNDASGHNQGIIMKFRKTSHVALAALIIVGACFSTSASAHSDGRIIRDILLAPLLLPAAIIAATVPQPVVYEETYYGGPSRGVDRYSRVERRGYAPSRDVQRHEWQRNDGRFYRRYR